MLTLFDLGLLDNNDVLNSMAFTFTHALYSLHIAVDRLTSTKHTQIYLPARPI